MSRLERIVAACGGELFDGGRRALIPGPGHSLHDRSVSLLEGADGEVLIYCFSPKDDWREVRRALMERGLLGPGAGSPDEPDPWTGPAPRAARAGERLLRAKRFWDQARPVAATLAERYLIGRAIAADLTHSPALRFHPRATSLEDRQVRPALVSAITDAGGLLQGVEITLLAPSGATKATLATPRRVVGKLLGGAIRLGTPHEQLIVAEGMESAASASAALHLPAWALLSAHNLALFAPPPNLKRLVVATDNDEAGRQAFDRLRRRLTSLTLERAPPPGDFNDWNDWQRAQR